MAPIKGPDTVRVTGLDDLRRELRKLDDDSLIDGLKDANYEVASDVVGWSRARAAALGGMEAKAAESLKAGRNQRRAEISFGGRAYEFAAGAVFGAYQDKLRLRKNNTGKKPSRAYIVRDNNDKAIAKATKRIEAQRNQRTGEQIRVTGRVVGWNQFRPWRGNGANAGYFLFPDIRAHEPEIVETYGDAIDKLTKKAFPD